MCAFSLRIQAKLGDSLRTLSTEIDTETNKLSRFNESLRSFITINLDPLYTDSEKFDSEQLQKSIGIESTINSFFDKAQLLFNNSKEFIDSLGKRIDKFEERKKEPVKNQVAFLKMSFKYLEENKNELTFLKISLSKVLWNFRNAAM